MPRGREGIKEFGRDKQDTNKVCVCVCHRERVKEFGRDKQDTYKLCVCVFVCVCVRERESERAKISYYF